MSGRTRSPRFYEHLLYRLFSDDGELLYVGRTNNVHRRFGRHSDLQPWWDEVSRSTIESFPTFVELCAAEKAAIIDEHPKYNVVYNGSAATGEELESLPAWLLVSDRATAAADALHGECRSASEANYPEEGPDESPACSVCMRNAVTALRAADSVMGANDLDLDVIADMLAAEPVVLLPEMSAVVSFGGRS